jgi:hypothetical protein
MNGDGDHLSRQVRVGQRAEVTQPSTFTKLSTTALTRAAKGLSSSKTAP